MPEPKPKLRVPVLIVGTGPAGLAASLLLQQYGVPALTVTRYGWTAHTPRAHHFNPRAMEMLRGLGLEAALHRNKMDQDLVRNIVWCVSLAGDELGRLETYHHVGAGGYVGLTPCDAINIPQHEFEPILADALMARNGKVLFNTECLEIRQTQSSVMARVRNRVTDETFWVEADYVIGADGAKSVVAEQIGLELEGATGWGAAVNLWIKADLSRFCDHRPGELWYTNLPGGDFWIGSGTFVAVKPWNEWIVTMMYDPAQGEPDLAEEVLQRRMHAIIGDDTIDIEILHSSKWLMNAQNALTYANNRVFCIGDAVRRHSPASGLGANTSMLDAYNLAWKLKLVLSGVADPSLLETYNVERQPLGKDVIRRSMESVMGHGAVAIALGYRPGQSLQEREETLREFFASSEQGESARAAVAAAIYALRYCYNAVGMEMGYRYESSATIPNGETYQPSPDPDLVYVPQVAAGAPLPHGVVIDKAGRQLSTIDLVAGGAFHLLTGPGGGVWSTVCEQLSKDTGLDIRVIEIGAGCAFEDLYGDWRRVRGVSDTGAVLVRPDAHVAWRADRGAREDTEALRSAVLSLLGRSAPAKVVPAERIATAVAG